jgi:hypothetical protein
VKVNRFLIYQKIEEEVNSLMKGNVERELVKKNPNPSRSSISKIFTTKGSFKKNDMQQKEFNENLGLLIVKTNLPIQFVDNVQFKILTLHLCPRINFPSKRQFLQDILPNLVEKTNQHFMFYLVFQNVIQQLQAMIYE